MSTNEFDRLIVEKFNQNEFEFKPAQWDKLSRELGEPTQETKKVIPFTGGWLKTAAIAAGLVAAVSVFGWLYTSNTADTGNAIADKNEQSTQHADGVTPSETATTTQAAIAAAKQETDVPATTPDAQAAQKTATGNQQPVKKNNGFVPQMPANIAQQIPNNKNIAEQTPITPNSNNNKTQQTNGTVIAASADQNKPKATQDVMKPETPMLTFRDNGTQGNIKNNRSNQHVNIGDEPMPMSARQKTSNTSLGLTGGMNYGSLNTGYTAGLTGRKKVVGNVYVEGDLAFVSNKADQASISESAFAVVANGDVNNLGTANVQPTSVKTANVEAVTNTFNYVQFTPAVGYQVTPKLSLSAGADFQRLLGYDDGMKNVVYENEQTKLAPTLDVGVTGKTEVAVTRKLKAGILYREGVNNIVRGSASKQYLERRYLQVQLKFTVFDKH